MLTLHLTGHSDIGRKRSINEDAWFAGPHGDGAWLLLVCDGLGGENAGEVASQLAVETVRAALPAGGTAEPALLLAAIRRADAVILEQGRNDPAKKGMGCTLTAAWIAGGRAVWGQAGDSKLFRWRRGALAQLTPEHSHVGRLRRSGEITEEEARRHPLRSSIEQSLGNNLGLFAPEAGEFELEPGDVLLACSDGLTDGLREAEIAAGLAGATPETLSAIAKQLVAQSVEKSGRDNTTAALALVCGEMVKPAADSTAPTRPWWRPW